LPHRQRPEASALQQITQALETPWLITTAGVASPAIGDLSRANPAQHHKCRYCEQSNTKKDSHLREQLSNHPQTSGRQSVSSSIEALIATYPSRHRAAPDETKANGASRGSNDAAGRPMQQFSGENDRQIGP